MTRENIWFRSTSGTNVPAWEDRGALTIGQGSFHYQGRNRTVTGRILSVGRTQMGTNRWVYVQYENQGQAGDAYFMDGAALGWAGVLGGNKRLAADLQAAQQT